MEDKGIPMPSPQQQNLEFNRIMDFLPNVSLKEEAKLTLDQQAEMSAKRMNSDYVEKVVQRARGLIQPARITDSFRQFIIDEMTVAAEVGFAPETREGVIRDAYFFLDSDDPNSGGIFDPSRAKHLERVAIARKTTLTLDREKRAMKLFGHDRAEKYSKPTKK